MDHPFNFQAPTGGAVPPPMRDAFSNIGTKMRAAHETHLGYPYNLCFSPGVPADLGQYLINNLGDPYFWVALRVRGLCRGTRGY